MPSIKPFLIVLFALISAQLIFAQGIVANPQAVRPQDPVQLGSGSTAAISGSIAMAYTTSMNALDDQRVLARGDRLSYRVVEEQKPPVPVMVTDSGDAEIPLIGRVTAAGKTCKQLALDVKQLLEKSYFYRCNVIIGLDVISELSRGTVYLTGNIKGQGVLTLPPRETITCSQAIFRAGGFADFANQKRVKIIRKVSPTKTKSIIVDVSKIIKKGDISNDPVLMPDDVIVVPEKLINF